VNNTVLYSLVESCKIINSSKIPKQRLFENIINPAKIVSLQHSISIAFSFVFVSDYFDQGSSIKNDVMYNTSVFCFVFFFFLVNLAWLYWSEQIGATRILFPPPSLSLKRFPLFLVTTCGVFSENFDLCLSARLNWQSGVSPRPIFAFYDLLFFIALVPF
jgi:hypothetical protein